MRTRPRGSPSWPGACSEAGYVGADCSEADRKTTCRRGGPYVFKCLLGLGVGLRMHGPGLLPGEVEAVQQVEHAVLAVAHAEAVLDEAAEILGRPALSPSRSGSGPRSTMALTPPSGLRQERRPATARPIAQAFDARGVEADDPVPERLAVHAGLFGCPVAAHAVERIGQSHEPAGYPAVRLEPRQAAQLPAGMSPRIGNAAPIRVLPSSPREGNHVLAQTTSRVSQYFAGLVLATSLAVCGCSHALIHQPREQGRANDELAPFGVIDGGRLGGNDRLQGQPLLLQGSDVAAMAKSMSLNSCSPYRSLTGDVPG